MQRSNMQRSPTSNIALVQNQQTTLQSILSELQTINQTLLNLNVGGGGGGAPPGSYLRVFQPEFSLTPSQELTILDVNEVGRLISVVFAAEHKNISMFVELFSTSYNSPLAVVDTDFQGLLKLGSGIAPGDVRSLPGPISPDPAGHPVDGFPWLMRWKDDTDTDENGNALTKYVMAYTPSQYTPYDMKVRVRLKNLTSANQKVNSVDIKRLVLAPTP